MVGGHIESKAGAQQVEEDDIIGRYAGLTNVCACPSITCLERATWKLLLSLACRIYDLSETRPQTFEQYSVKLDYDY